MVDPCLAADGHSYERKDTRGGACTGLRADYAAVAGLTQQQLRVLIRTRIDHDARGLTARGALFTTKRVSFFWAVVSQLSRGLLEGVRPYRLVVRS